MSPILVERMLLRTEFGSFGTRDEEPIMLLPINDGLVAVA